MSDILGKNLSVLKNSSPLIYLQAEFYFKKNKNVSFEFTFNKENQLFSKRDNISLHSFYKPIEEANGNVKEFLINNRVNSKSIIVQGGALFYHLEFLVQYFDNIILLEYDSTLFFELLKVKDLSVVLEKTQIIIPEIIKDLRSSKQNNSILLSNFYQAFRLDLIYKHNPSVQLNKKYYDFVVEILLRLSSNEKKIRNSIPKIKILLVGPIYGGSLPVFNYCNKSLTELNQEVITIDFSSYRTAMQNIEKSSNLEGTKSFLLKEFSDFLGKIIITKARENDVQLVIGIAQSPLTTQVCNKLKETGILTSFWFVEDFRTLQYWQTIAPSVDYFFTIQKDEFYQELSKLGLSNFHYLPMAYSTYDHQKIEVESVEKKEFGSDLSFVGAGYYNRQRSFVSLLEYNFKIWGNNWPSGGIYNKVLQRKGERVSTLDINKIFNSSTINLNLHSSTYIEHINPDGDFVNPRTFEIAGSKNFQLVDGRNLMDELFYDDEIATYKSMDDLAYKIDLFISNNNNRKEFIDNSFTRVNLEHTYTHRMFEMLSYILQKEKLLNDLNPEIIDLEKLKDDLLKNNINIGKYLDKLPKDNRNLDGLVKVIQNQNKELDNDEAVVLMMYEFYRFAKRKKII